MKKITRVIRNNGVEEYFVEPQFDYFVWINDEWVDVEYLDHEDYEQLEKFKGIYTVGNDKYNIVIDDESSCILWEQLQGEEKDKEIDFYGLGYDKVIYEIEGEVIELVSSRHTSDSHGLYKEEV